MRTVACWAALALTLTGCAASPRPAQPLHATQPSHAAQRPAKRAVLLTGVSCTGRACVAVGWYYTSAAGPRRPLAERWAGHRWRLAGHGPIAGSPRVSCVATCLVVAPGPRWLRLRAWCVLEAGSGQRVEVPPG